MKRPIWLQLVALTALTAGLYVALTLAGLPAVALLAALVSAAALTVIDVVRMTLPRPVMTGAQAVMGVTIGTMVTPKAAREVVSYSYAVTLALVLTLIASALAGWALMRITNLDRATAQLGMVAGGASGVVAISEQTGADGRVVAMVQYIRVYMVIALLPLGTLLDTGDRHDHPPAASATHTVDQPVALIVLALCGGVGLAIALLARVPSGTLLCPMLLTTGVGLVTNTAYTLPPVVQNAALLVIGIHIGLQFTRESLRQIGGMAVKVIAVMLLLIVLCALAGIALSTMTHASPFEGYLATTPGGLYAVLGMAVGSNANIAFITSIQIARVFVVMLIIPLLGRWFRPDEQDIPDP